MRTTGWRSIVRFFLLLVPLPFAAGCMAHDVRARAASELKCPREAVSVSREGITEVWDAKGCGRAIRLRCAPGEIGEDAICEPAERH